MDNKKEFLKRLVKIDKKINGNRKYSYRLKFFIAGLLLAHAFLVKDIIKLCINIPIQLYLSIATYIMLIRAALLMLWGTLEK